MDDLSESPVHVEENWGVELDAFGSVDYYPSKEEAVSAAYESGCRVVRVIAEVYKVEEEETEHA